MNTKYRFVLQISGNLLVHQCQETVVIKWLFGLELTQAMSRVFGENLYVFPKHHQDVNRP